MLVVGDKQWRVPLVSACRILQLLVTVSKERDEVSWHEELHSVPTYTISKFSHFNAMVKSVCISCVILFLSVSLFVHLSVTLVQYIEWLNKYALSLW